MKKALICAVAVMVLAVKPVVFAATIYIDDGLSHTFDASYDNHGDNVILDSIITNTPGTHVDVIDGCVLTESLSAAGNSSINMTGGEIGILITSDDNATVTLSGGSVGAIGVSRNGVVYLDGTGFEVDGNPLVNGDKLSDFGTFVHDLIDGDYYEGFIIGTLADGSALANGFWIYNMGTYAGTGDIIIVPEPATMLLLGLGGLMLRRKKRG